MGVPFSLVCGVSRPRVFTRVSSVVPPRAAAVKHQLDRVPESPGITRIHDETVEITGQPIKRGDVVCTAEHLRIRSLVPKPPDELEQLIVDRPFVSDDGLDRTTCELRIYILGAGRGH